MFFPLRDEVADHQQNFVSSRERTIGRECSSAVSETLGGVLRNDPMRGIARQTSVLKASAQVVVLQNESIVTGFCSLNHRILRGIAEASRVRGDMHAIRQDLQLSVRGRIETPHPPAHW